MQKFAGIWTFFKTFALRTLERSATPPVFLMAWAGMILRFPRTVTQCYSAQNGPMFILIMRKV